uniref:FAD-binding and (Fe-S)-binding domain-containing protein n=1 Tax=Indioceanicola profundi TaxID=2220096 RepID=UPI00298D8CD0|nr:FAD-binding and (Fe-S)-binding domain-containing protein [Indioceanicola profundi]
MLLGLHRPHMDLVALSNGLLQGLVTQRIQPMLPHPYADVLTELADLIPPTRLITDPLRTLAYGTDASFYRLVPKIVAVVESEAEVQHLLGIANRFATPVTFRAAGTSLSGQAVTSSILVLLGDGWNGCGIPPDAATITLQPGVIGAEANRRLASFGRRIGPDPASIATAKIGGIAANNASGMCCGTAQNTYHTLRSMRIVLSDGTLVDTGDPASRTAFAQTHAAMLAALDDIGKRTRADSTLSQRIAEKFRIKNTTGYSINALVDFSDPIDILQHLMVGSEGTLGFIAGITLATVPDLAHKASAMLFFDDIAAACRAAAALTGVAAAVELMDRSALRSVQDKLGQVASITELGPGATALLIEARAEDDAALSGQIDRLGVLLTKADTIFPVEFSRDPAACDTLWKIRKGLFPAVGAMRRPGTTVIIEDIAVPVEQLASASVDLQTLFASHGYDEAIIFGHALEGNLHFVFTQDFGSEAEVERYARFMDDVAALVVCRYDGSLKAEHGTGRNMAPFVEMEWGEQAYRLMREIKELLDPAGLLNPGVILSEDAEIHLKHLKPLPAADKLVDMCIECGFCEPACPSHMLTLSPRQRIVGQREIASCGSAGVDVAEIMSLFDYQAIDSCAACGLCATVCPVGIETGLLMKQARGQRHGPISQKAARIAADHPAPLLNGVRAGLKMLDRLQALAGPARVQTAAKAMRRISSGRLPLLPKSLPTPAACPTDPGDDRQAPVLIYVPSCVSRSMGPSAGEPDMRALPDVVRSIAAKAGIGLLLPDGLDNLCCGMPMESKGLAENGNRMADRLLETAFAAGNLPILMDTSPCAFRLKQRLAGSGSRLLDVTEFLHDYALPRLQITRADGPIVLHTTCSSRRMGLEKQLRAVAEACSDSVVIPTDVGCCGFAGDKGFTLPELNAHALRHLPASVPSQDVGGYSTSRTCEIGLSHHSGIVYRSVAYLVDLCARSASPLHEAEGGAYPNRLLPPENSSE